MTAITKRRKPWLAAVLSFVTTGLGQIYNGQLKKGLIFFGIETLLGFGAFIAMGSLEGMVGGITLLLGFNLFVAIEAYRSATVAGQYSLGPFNRWWVYALLIIANLAVGTTLDVISSNAFYKTFKVPSESMLQTLRVGDHFMAEILTDDTPLLRGDVIVFEEPKTNKYFVKRVIGLPGDTFAMRSKEVFIGGIKQDEPYVLHTKDDHEPQRDSLKPLVLGPDEYFVMGDNRDASFDSRWMGPIKREIVKARAKYLYFPSNFGEEGWFERLGSAVR